MRIPKFYLTYVKDSRNIKNEAMHLQLDVTSYLFDNRVFFLNQQLILNILSQFDVKYQNCKIKVYNPALENLSKLNHQFICEIHSEYEQQQLFLVLEKKNKLKNVQKQINQMSDQIILFQTQMNLFFENFKVGNYMMKQIDQETIGPSIQNYKIQKDLLLNKEQKILNSSTLNQLAPLSLTQKLSCPNFLPLRFQEDQSSSQNFLDIAIMYSEPLVIVNKTGFRKALNEPVEFRSEINNLKDIFGKSKKQIQFKVEIATKENFIEIMKKRPKILHFICHGDFNKEESMFYLGFEKANGELDQCTSKNLRTLMSKLVKEGENLELVFVNACYSEEIGQVFIESGIKCVVCVQSEVKIEDTIAQQFSSHFYSSLIEGYSIEESFSRARSFIQFNRDKEIYTCCCAHSHKQNCKWQDLAQTTNNYNYGHSLHIPFCDCKKKLQQIHLKNCSFAKQFFQNFPDVDNMESQKEAAKHVKLEKNEVFVCCCSPHLPHNETLKFQILTSQDQIKKSCIFKYLSEGILIDQSYAQFDNYFIQNCNIYGRNIEIQEIFLQFSTKNTKFIELYGESGIGKTTLVKAAANYMNERKLFPDGIKYIDLHNIKFMNTFLTKFKEGVYPSEEKFCEINKTAKKLYIFDNCDSLLNPTSLVKFQDYLKHLNENTKYLKFIIITHSKRSLDLHNSLISQVTYLTKELCIELLVDLAGNKLPYSLRNKNNWEPQTPYDIFEFVKRTPKEIIAIAQTLNENQQSTLKTIYQEYQNNKQSVNTLYNEEQQIQIALKFCFNFKFKFKSFEIRKFRDLQFFVDFSLIYWGNFIL